MAINLLVSPAMAAVLTGRSDKHIRKLIEQEVLPAGGDVHKHIPMAAVEELAGRAMTHADMGEALELLEKRRAYYRRRQRARRREERAGGPLA